jgi:hypothetical protein
MKIIIEDPCDKIISLLISKGYNLMASDGNDLVYKKEKSPSKNMRVDVRTFVKNNQGCLGSDIIAFGISKGYSPATISSFLSRASDKDYKCYCFNKIGDGLKEAKFYFDN